MKSKHFTLALFREAIATIRVLPQQKTMTVNGQKCYILFPEHWKDKGQV